MDAYQQIMTEWGNMFDSAKSFGGKIGRPDSLIETETSMILDIDLPGLNKETIDVSVDDDILKVRATKREAPSGKILWGSTYGNKISKDYVLGAKVAVDNIDAEYIDGEKKVKALITKISEESDELLNALSREEKISEL